MRVEHAEGGLLEPEIRQDATEHRVLEHVGETAGMEGMTIIQECALTAKEELTEDRA
jgi:hypothetical protein